MSVFTAALSNSKQLEIYKASIVTALHVLGSLYMLMYECIIKEGN